MADPPAGAVPAATDLVGVGVDTTQRFMIRTSVDCYAAVAPGLPRLYGWDVTGTNPITPKAGALSINRPDGSGPGFTALINTTIGTLDSQNINAPFLATPYGRSLWHIFRSAEYTGTNAHGVALRSVFGPQGWICAHPAVIVAHGFVPIANCGSVTNT
ncbi:hypothetical protein ACFZCK_10300 [Kitasatospora purpeofusca]|uniref:hypothetical protein n=1 Tax=Kitasatospora purpeofusca TaxID=67352 RepID=UPI0036E7D8EE